MNGRAGIGWEHSVPAVFFGLTQYEDRKDQLESAALNTSIPKKIRLPRAERELQILEVALEMFISKGYQGTSMEDIAEAAGISRPIVYNLFGTKDAIYLACLRDARQHLDQRLV